MYHCSITADAVASNSIKFPIPGYPNYFADVDGNIWSAKRGALKRLSPSVQKNGYLMLMLKVDKKPRWQYVHALMMLTFVGPRPDAMVICHGPDPSKAANQINNLRYDTRSANTREWVSSGMAHGRPGGPKLNPDRVRDIRRLKGAGWTNSDLAKLHGVNLDTIRRVIDRTSWAHVV